MAIGDKLRQGMKISDEAGSTVKKGLGAFGSDFAILVYPLFAFLIFLITLPAIDGLILAVFNAFAHESIFNADQHTAKIIFYYIATVATLLYTAIAISYFTCVISAAVLANLEDRPAPFVYGLKQVGAHIGTITRFGMFSIPFFFIPVGLFVQRQKLRKDPVSVIGSSYSLSMAQLAPTIFLKPPLGFSGTIRETFSTLGKAWKQGLVIKIACYAVLIFLAVLSLLANKVEHLFNDSTSHDAGWLVTALLFLCFLIATKVLSAVFSATLYHRITTEGKDI